MKYKKLAITFLFSCFLISGMETSFKSAAEEKKYYEYQAKKLFGNLSNINSQINKFKDEKLEEVISKFFNTNQTEIVKYLNCEVLESGDKEILRLYLELISKLYNLNS